MNKYTLKYYVTVVGIVAVEAENRERAIEEVHKGNGVLISSKESSPKRIRRITREIKNGKRK